LELAVQAVKLHRNNLFDKEIISQEGGSGVCSGVLLTCKFSGIFLHLISLDAQAILTKIFW